MYVDVRNVNKAVGPAVHVVGTRCMGTIHPKIDAGAGRDELRLSWGRCQQGIRAIA
jgi:hypothetical protein